MISKKNILVVILLSFLLSACPSSDDDDPVATNPCSVDFDITVLTVVDHVDALTDAGGDNAFNLTIDTATGTLPLSCFDIAVQSATSGDPDYFIMLLTHNDNDADTLVSQGDSFDAVEIGSNVFPASDNGQALDILLIKDFSGSISTIGVGPWTWNPA